MCKEVLENWDPETIAYATQPKVSGVYQDYCRVLKNQYSWKEFDVTSLARKWYLGENHGVQLSAPESKAAFRSFIRAKRRISRISCWNTRASRVWKAISPTTISLLDWQGLAVSVLSMAT